MASSPSNLKRALDEYEANQRRQAALAEAQRIGQLIHIQEQKLVAAKHLAKQRKHARRQQHQQLLQQQVILDTLPESALEDDDDESDERTTSSASPSQALAARRAARRANKLASQNSSVTAQDENAHASSSASISASGSSSIANPTPKFASHKRRPNEPYAFFRSRSLWKPDSHANRCDNILCRKQFSFLGEKRHHCRRCGNIFCAACLSHREVLYDMDRSYWQMFPERLLASIFPEPLTATVHTAASSSSAAAISQPVSSPPSSPALTALSSSFESSGSSHASSDSFEVKPPSEAGSTSTSSRFVPQPPRPKNKKPLFDSAPVVWEKGTGEYVPTPVPEDWREHVLDVASEEPVCDDCHCVLWGVDTPTNLFYKQRALRVEREEIAWAIWIQGLDKWDACLRKHGLTLKKTPEEQQREVDERKQARKERRGSSTSENTTFSAKSCVPMRFPTREEEANDDLDYAGRPMHTKLYAWPTAPECIRFTTAALKPKPAPQVRDKEPPSIFGMHRSVPRYIPTPTLPPPPVLTPEQLAEKRERELERIEQDRQKRYRAALDEFLMDAYAMGELGDEYKRRIYYKVAPEPTKWECLCDELSRHALDVASRWRGDNWGGW